MFKTKFIISSTIFILLLIITSVIKNKTRVIEKKISILNSKIFSKEKNLNEAQLDFFYLSSPSEIEKKIKTIGFIDYQPIKHSKIYFDIKDLTSIQSKTSNLKKLDEKQIKK